MAGIDDLIEARATFLINTILEEVRNDHEEEHVHEDHQEEWEALVAREFRAVIDRLKIVDEAEANALAPQTKSFDEPAVLGALEKLLFGIHSQAPREWMVEQATEAQTIFWKTMAQLKNK